MAMVDVLVSFVQGYSQYEELLLLLLNELEDDELDDEKELDDDDDNELDDEQELEDDELDKDEDLWNATASDIMSM